MEQRKPLGLLQPTSAGVVAREYRPSSTWSKHKPLNEKSDLWLDCMSDMFSYQGSQDLSASPVCRMLCACQVVAMTALGVEHTT